MTCAVVAVLLFGGAVTDEPLLSLDEAVRTARASHPKVDAARAQLDVARAQLSPPPPDSCPASPAPSGINRSRPTPSRARGCAAS